jgi:hypothetical protein
VIRIEFIGLVSLGLFVAACITWWSHQFEESTFAVVECVSDIWEESEARTGVMPTVEEEKAWWSKCSETVAND